MIHEHGGFIEVFDRFYGTCHYNERINAINISPIEVFINDIIACFTEISSDYKLYDQIDPHRI